METKGKGYQKSSIQIFQNQKKIIVLIRLKTYILISFENENMTVILCNSAICYLLDYEGYQEMLVTAPLLKAVIQHLITNLAKIPVTACGPVDLMSCCSNIYLNDGNLYQFDERFLIKRINPTAGWINRLVKYISQQDLDIDSELEQILELQYCVIEDGKGSMVIRIPTSVPGSCTRRHTMESSPEFASFLKQVDEIEKVPEKAGPFPFVQLDPVETIETICDLLQYQIDHDDPRPKTSAAEWFRFGTECFKFNLDHEKYRSKVGHRLPIKIFEKGYIVEMDPFFKAIKSVTKIYISFGSSNEWIKFFDVVSGEERILIDKNGRFFRVTECSAKFLAYMISQKETQSTTEAYLTSTSVPIENFKKDFEQLCPGKLMKIVDPTLEVPRDLHQFDNLLEETVISTLSIKY